MTKEKYLLELAHLIKENHTTYDNRLSDEDGKIDAFNFITKEQPEVNMYIAQCFDTKCDDENIYMKLKWQDEWFSLPIRWGTGTIMNETHLLLFWSRTSLDEIFDFDIYERGYTKRIIIRVKQPTNEPIDQAKFFNH